MWLLYLHVIPYWEDVKSLMHLLLHPHASVAASITCPPLHPPLYLPHVHHCTHCTSTIVPIVHLPLYLPTVHPLLHSLHIHHCACCASIVMLLCLSCAHCACIVLPVMHVLLRPSYMHCCACHVCVTHGLCIGVITDTLVITELRGVRVVQIP